jgi:hypothetical protein
MKSPAYFSIIHACPNKLSMERVSVGVAIVQEDAPTLVMMAKHYERVRQLFGEETLNLTLLEYAKERVAYELKTLVRGKAQFEEYRGRQAGILMPSELRGIVIVDAENDLLELFADAVTDPEPSP